MGWNVKNIFHALLFMVFVISTEADTKVTFTPSTYKIDIETEKAHFEKPESEALTYTGTVTVEFTKNAKILNEAFIIALDTNPHTEVKAYKLEGKSGAVLKNFTAKCPHEISGGKLKLKCSAEVGEIDEFKLKVDYKNPFGKDMTGFYRSSYTDSSNKTRWLLTTHFEPIFARNAFPCFDQPNLKAKFTVSVKVPEDVTTVLSNTEEAVTSVASDGFKTYKFKETDIPMSTYLVAFTASTFKSTPEIKFTSDYKKRPASPIDLAQSTKSLRTYGREEIILEQGKFAQTVGKAAIEKLTEYLGEGYALNKVDQVGIPDFSAGAMENFGHISFREKSLFCNKDTSTMTKQSNLLTIVHELVHQWFGNLVTLESWDYIWLNEAFATYLEYIIASKLEDSIGSKEWKLMEQLVVNEIHSRAFETDGLTTSKPLTNEITDENLIFSAFNDIPYSKGAAVLRMWDFSLPASKFQEGLKKYIQSRKEKSANPNELFEALKYDKILDEAFFNTWTKQKGYPVVEVQKTAAENYKLTQARFTWEKSTPEGKWKIPITYFTDADSEDNRIKTEPKSWLVDEKPLELKGVKGKWIVVNNNQAGYYRVNYDTENWKALAEALNQSDHSKIPELNRAQIINDVFSLARSVQKNYVNYSLALNMTKYLSKEKAFTPLKTALNSLDFLLTKVRKNDKTFEKFKEYVIEFLKPHFVNLCTEGKSHVENLKKVEVSRWACSLDYEPCVKEAKSLYKANNYTNYPDIQEVVLCTVVRTDKNAWDKIFEKYKWEKDSALRVMYITALGCTSDSKKANDFLYNTLKADSGIRKQDLMFVLSAVYNGNIKNLDTAFDFVEKNFTDIATIYGGINPLGRAVVGIARKITTESQCQRLEKLVTKIKACDQIKGASESLDNALKIAKGNCEWDKVKMEQISTYFNGTASFASSLSLLLLCLLFVLRL